jgi:hypothetical protein
MVSAAYPVACCVFFFSFTFFILRKRILDLDRCQMNNQTRATKADELVLDTVFNYYEPIPVRYYW